MDFFVFFGCFVFLKGFCKIFVFIGILSTLKNRHTSADYLLAGQSVKPWLVALSAVATNNSGYMFIGMIGYTYMVGLSSIWLMVGWIFGDFLASLTIYSRLRKAAGRTGAMSYSHVLSAWQGSNQAHLQKIIALVSLAFLFLSTFYRQTAVLRWL